MKVAEGQWARLQFLARVTEKECQYLLETDQRLFAFVPVLIDTAKRLSLQIDKLAS